jgi:hypothetical protein
LAFTAFSSSGVREMCMTIGFKDCQRLSNWEIGRHASVFRSLHDHPAADEAIDEAWRGRIHEGTWAGCGWGAKRVRSEGGEEVQKGTGYLPRNEGKRLTEPERNSKSSAALRV